MPLLKFATKEEIPAEDAENAMTLADGTFAVFKDIDTTELSTALDKERGKREAAEKLATRTANELRKVETKGAADKAGIDGEKLKEIEAAIKAASDAEHAPTLAERDALKTKLRVMLLDNQIKAAAGEHGKVMTQHADDFLKLYGDRFDVADDDTLVVKANPGIPVKQLVQELAGKQKAWVQGSLGTGGGQGGSQSIAASINPGQVTTDMMFKNPGALLEMANAPK